MVGKEKINKDYDPTYGSCIISKKEELTCLNKKR